MIFFIFAPLFGVLNIKIGAKVLLFGARCTKNLVKNC